MLGPLEDSTANPSSPMTERRLHLLVRSRGDGHANHDFWGCDESIGGVLGRRRRHEPLGAMALLLGAIACGPAPSENAEAVAQQQSALPGEWVSCLPHPMPTPPGYPQRTSCMGNKPPFASCRCYPADVTSSDPMTRSSRSCGRRPGT